MRLCQSSYLPPKFDLLISLRLLFFPTFFLILIMAVTSFLCQSQLFSHSTFNLSANSVSEHGQRIPPPRCSLISLWLCVCIKGVHATVYAHAQVHACVCVSGVSSPLHYLPTELTSGHRVWQQMHHLTSSQLH